MSGETSHASGGEAESTLVALKKEWGTSETWLAERFEQRERDATRMGAMEQRQREEIEASSKPMGSDAWKGAESVDKDLWTPHLGNYW